MSRRYQNRDSILNDLDQYKQTFARRNRRYIVQYSTPALKDLSMSELSSIETFPYRWTLGDKFYKLAAEFYGDPELWWVIAWFNKKPTDSHARQGDLIYIPNPIDEVLAKLEV